MLIVPLVSGGSCTDPQALVDLRYKEMDFEEYLNFKMCIGLFKLTGLQTICTVPLPDCACGQVLQSWNYICLYSFLCKMDCDGCLDSDGCQYLMTIS